MSEKIEEIYDFEEFRLNVSERLLLRQNEPVTIPEKAFEVLRLLVRNAGNLVEKEEILRKVWTGTFVEENNLDKNISILRRALGEQKGGKKFIETVRRHGYRFVAGVKRIGEEETKTDLSKKTPLPFQQVSRELKIRRSGNVLALAEWRREAEPGENKNETTKKKDATAPPIFEAEEINPSNDRKILLDLRHAAVLVLIVFAAGYFINRFLPPFSANNSPAAVFDRFKIKRFFDNGSFNPSVISRDGKFVAFTDKDYAVWLKNTTTDGNIKVLPENKTGERFIIGISPDDSYIYFRFVPLNKRSEILKIAIFGGDSTHKIAEDAWSQPALSPDGKQISFTRFDSETGKFSLVAAMTDGTSERTIAVSRENERFDSWNQNTAWSPDAKQIACLGRSEIGETVRRYIQIFQAADGAETSRVPLDPMIRSLQALIWLPDGDDLLVIGDDEASVGQIYRYRISNKIWRRVTNDLTDYLNLSVTADGKTILTNSFQNQSNLWILPESNAAFAKQITFGFNSIDDATGVSWTADGRIVYATNASGRWEIWMINADGTNQKQLTQNFAGNDACTMPFVSTDNRYIVFQASRAGENNIWRMDLNGENPVQITFDGGMLPFVTADSSSVIYVRKKVSTATLRQISMEGGESKQISNIAPIFLGNSAPDGSRLAIVFYDKAARQPFQTCVAAPQADAPEKCFGKSRAFPQWTADGKAFYYLAHDYSQIRKQYLDGRNELFLEFPGERINNFAFSPDGKKMVVARSKPTQDIVALIIEQ